MSTRCSSLKALSFWREKRANHIQNRGLMYMFTDVCACEIRRREVNEACRCACPYGTAPSKVSTSDDACVDHFLISAKSVTLLSRLLSAPMYTNFA